MMEGRPRRRNLLPDFFRSSFFSSSRSKSNQSSSSQEKSKQNLAEKTDESKSTGNYCYSSYSSPSIESKAKEKNCSSQVQQEMPPSFASIPSTYFPSIPSLTPMMLPMLGSSSSSTTSNSQVDAQTALLLAVIRATPNEVFYGLARDILWNAYKSLTTSVYNVVQDNFITSRLPVVNQGIYSRRDRKRTSNNTETELTSDSDVDNITENDSGIDFHRRRKLGNNRNRRNKFDNRYSSQGQNVIQQQKPSSSGDYVVVKAFLKIIIKLYLTLILEVVTLALKFLG